MTTRDTAKALSAITDTGFFENLATTVLRYADPLYADLSHTGINADGKTRKAPLDGVTFVRGASPRHMIAVHHTTGAAAGLEKKWLLDPSKINRRESTKTPLPDPGDLLKTAAVVAAERVGDPDMRATLVLTSTEEPDHTLISLVRRQAGLSRIEIDFWPRERITDFLDVDGDGQWIRRKFLGTPVRRLSQSLLSELSILSLARLQRQLGGQAWVPRLADGELDSLNRPIVLVEGPSGAGKTVLCLERLQRHQAADGIAIVLSHAFVDQANTLEAAIDLALRDLEPSLEPHQSAISLCTPDRPLLLLLEDINRSADPARLVEKVLTWAPAEKEQATSWRLLCPIWPTTWARLDEATRKKAAPMLFQPTPMSAVECALAVEARAKGSAHPLSFEAASSIAEELGYDPLLIGLFDFKTNPRPGRVITDFVEVSLQRASTGSSAWQLRSGLSDLGDAMLRRRRLDPVWSELSAWGLSPATLEYLTAIANEGGVLQKPLGSDRPTVHFRHDRVRDAVLSQTLMDLEDRGVLEDGLVGDPFYAELLATVAANRPTLVSRLEALNPLALALALGKFDSGGAARAGIVQALDRWLGANASGVRTVASLRWRIGAALGGTIGSDILPLARHWPEEEQGWRIGLRGGDLMSAVRLMIPFPPGMKDRVQEAAIDDAGRSFGEKYVRELTVALANPKNIRTAYALLRLAGYLADPRLAAGIAAAWAHAPEDQRRQEIRDFVWAATRCFDPAESPALLDEVCDVWAVVEEGPEGQNDATIIAKMALPQALEFRMPIAALPYLRDRALSDDLRGPLLDVLERIDDPDTIEFVVEQRSSATGGRTIFGMPWERRLKDGQFPMSSESRERLKAIWASTARDAEARRLAFRLWLLTPDNAGFESLRAVASDHVLRELALSARLSRGDPTALVEIVDKLDNDDTGREWERVRKLSDPQIGAALDRALGKLVEQQSGENYLAFQLQGALMRMQPGWAESTLSKHPEAAERFRSIFQVLLFIATPKALDRAMQIVSSHQEPTSLFANIGVRFMGVMGDHPGISRREQMNGVILFRDKIDDQNLRLLALACNGLGWFDLRDLLFADRQADPTIKFDERALAADLDRALSSRFASDLLDRTRGHLATGASWSEVRSVALEWLSERENSQDAFDLISDLFVYFGDRDDISTLESLAGRSPDLCAAASNAAFEIRRRSLR
ncbi:MAG: hypothetical protein K2X25_00500 [Caulobacteraceae bacterium]|nr:hypothetical protein [Caulobacteraceae bacterium]